MQVHDSGLMGMLKYNFTLRVVSMDFSNGKRCCKRCCNVGERVEVFVKMAAGRSSDRPSCVAISRFCNFERDRFLLLSLDQLAFSEITLATDWEDRYKGTYDMLIESGNFSAMVSFDLTGIPVYPYVPGDHLFVATGKSGNVTVKVVIEVHVGCNYEMITYMP
jgi:hypothetical protein